MPNKRWSEEDIVDLRERVARGDSVPAIAAAIGRSQEATRARMQTMGLTNPRSFKRERLRLQATEDVLA
ncbi:hypothetical protein ACVWZA_003407 [Sphingomonas sp. UYAg733]